MKRAMLLAGLLAAMTLSLGCGPRMASSIFRGAVVGAAIVGTAAIIADHDAHFHHHNCGCPRHWQDNRWVYYYGDGWEYYDPHAGVWYRH